MACGRRSATPAGQPPTDLVNAFRIRDGDRWVSVWVNGFGGWGTSTSPGWTGDTIVWIGRRGSGSTRPLRSTLARRCDTGLAYKEETERDCGAWSPIFEVTCGRT